jgi:hypothetical protein
VSSLWAAKAGPKTDGGLELRFGLDAPNLVYKGTTLPLIKYNKGELGSFRVTYYSRLGI